MSAAAVPGFFGESVSVRAVVTLVRGDVLPGLVGMVASTALRGLLIMGGLYLVGEREHLVRNALGASAAIELFVLAWVIQQTRSAADSRSA